MISMLSALIAQGEKVAKPSKVSPRSSKTLGSAVHSLVETENAKVGVERQVSLRSALTVAQRSLNRTKALDERSRFFAAYKEVCSFISLAYEGNHDNGTAANSDLLPVGHPLSTRKINMSTFSLQEARARWIAADPRVNDSVRELVASAYSAEYGSVERTHAFHRINALTPGLIPQEFKIDSVVAAGIGGNSSAARSLRAHLQRRDKHGKFAFMGGGMQFYLKGLDGKISSVTGRFAGNSAGSDSFIVEITNNPTLKDGLYEVPANKTEAFKAILPDEALKHNENVKVDQNVDAVDVRDLKGKEAPDGWNLLPKLQGGADKLFKSDDNYVVSYFAPDENGGLSKQGAAALNSNYKKAKQNGHNVKLVPNDGEGSKFSKGALYNIFRGKTDHTEMQFIGAAQNWSDTQVIVSGDENNFDKDVAKAEKNKPSAPAKQEELFPEEPKKSSSDKITEAKQAYADAIASIEQNISENKDGFGNVAPKEWTAKKNFKKYNGFYINGSLYADPSNKDYLQEIGVPVAKNQVIFTREQDNVSLEATTNEDGSINFNGQSYKSWDDVENAVADYVEQKYVDTRQAAKDVVAFYDTDGHIAKMIDANATPDEVLAELKKDPNWASSLDDYQTSSYVDLPSPKQKEKWNSFGKNFSAIRNMANPYSGEKKPVTPEPTPTVEHPDPENKPFTDWTVPEGAYKLNTLAGYEPEGRVDEDSKDFTDDPKVLANKFSKDELINALSESLIGTHDFASMLIEELNNETDEDDEEAPKAKSKPGPKPKAATKPKNATGAGALDFSQGSEYVLSEALYEALKEKGLDADKLVADIYDMGLGDDSNNSALEAQRTGVKNKEETIDAVRPSVLLDLDLGFFINDIHAKLAEPGPAAYSVSAIDTLKNNGEQNKNILELANEISNLTDNAQYSDLLSKHIDWAFSNKPEDQEAFRALWGTLLALDGGASEEGEESDLMTAVSDAIKKYNGSVTETDLDSFYNTYGFFSSLVYQKAGIAKGTIDITETNNATGFFHLVAASAKPNDKILFRGIELKVDSEVLNEYTTLDNVIALDPRSFTDDKATAGNWAGAFRKNSGQSSVIFTVKESQADALDLSKVSMFQDEHEYIVYGDYKIIDVSTKELPGTNGRVLHNVEIAKVSTRDKVLEGYSDTYSSLLLKNEAQDLPEGYHVPDPAAYETTENTDSSIPSDFTDSPLYIARTWESSTLVDAFREAIENGTGTDTLEYPIEDGYEAKIPVESIRDALQIQGVDTNALLKDIADAGNNPEVSTIEDHVFTSEVGSHIFDLATDIGTEGDLEGFKKTGPQQGSNPGGTYTNTDGVEVYIKTPKSDLHAQNEVLASALYRALDVPAAEIYLGSADDGKLKTYSPMIEGATSDLSTKLKDPEYLAKLQDGFAVDAWLANWDVAGLVFDNVVTDENGDPVRVDPGGALLFRAQGAPKGKMFGNTVTELDTLRDPKMNPQSAAIFGSMTDDQQKASAAKLLEISNEDIGTLVHAVISDPETAADLVTTLEARRYDILQRYGLLADDTSLLVDNNKVEEPTTSKATTPEPVVEAPKAPTVETPKTPSDNVNNPYISSDGTPIEIGMKVSHNKTGEVGTVIKYDKGNSSYVYVQDDSGGKPKVKSTKQLTPVKGNGETEQTPAPENPTAPEEAPTPTPEAPKQETTELPTEGKLDNGVSYKIQDSKVGVSPYGKESSKIDGVTVTLGGNTFKNKQAIKDAGFKWDGDKKVWSKNYVELASFPALSKTNIEKDLQTVNNGNAVKKEVAPAATPEVTAPELPQAKAPEEPKASEGVPPAPDGVKTLTDASGNEVYPGVEIKDKKGNVGSILKVNEENYALVEFQDGTKGWRSANTINATGGVNNPKVISSTVKASKKATAAGVPPVIVSQPSDWSSSDFADTPSLVEAISTVMNTDDFENAMHGASAVVDSDSIEDLDVRVMHVQDENGVDGFRLKFKLTSWAANDLVSQILSMSSDEKEKAGIKITGMRVDRIDIGPDGVGHVNTDKHGWQDDQTSYTYTITTPDGIVIKINRANKDATNKFVSGHYSKAPKAFHNLVTVQVPATATPDQVAKALTAAGVKDARPGTKADMQVLIENRLMSIFDAKTNANVNLKGALREASLARIKEKWGITPDDVEVVTGASGRIETRLSVEGATKIWEATGKPAAIQHNLSIRYSDEDTAAGQGKENKGDIASASWIVRLFSTPQGGILSTTTRWTEGIGTNGMSSQSDVGTGGADYVFTKPVMNASAKEHGVSSHTPAMYFDPIKLYQRLDFYANQHDAYGKRSDNKDVISAAKVGAYEVMFKGRISWDDLDVVVMTPEIRSLVIADLKDKGIMELGGRPIEEVITIGTKKQ